MAEMVGGAVLGTVVDVGALDGGEGVRMAEKSLNTDLVGVRPTSRRPVGDEQAGDEQIIEARAITERGDSFRSSDPGIDLVEVRPTSRRPVGDEQVVDEHFIEARAITERAFSGDPGKGPSTSVRYIQQFAHWASTFNWGAVVLILGSYGLLLSNPLFWLCWSILVTKAVIYYSIQPYWEWIEDSTRTTDESEGTRKPHRFSDHGGAGAIILKVGMSIALIILILHSEDITQRQNTVLLIVAASIILFEGFMPLLVGREELSLWRNPLNNITEDQKWKALIFFTPSAIHAIIFTTGPIVLGGDLGQLMRKEAFWGFGFIFLVDLLAEVIRRFGSGRHSPSVMAENLPKNHYVAVILRLVVEGCLCCWMTKEICQEAYFSSHLASDVCNRLCRERSKQLLITMVALGGLQATGTFIAPLCSCLLGPRDVPNKML
ncbi:uncharacterized protein LOC131071936 isoform X2 [Cryptomeria japonica]|uniref:uncharacterized protein LOC131071936 isoform X2 n=1 Tax=Cryptomeria japonica TaxID=3369 RepID=UPI0025AB8D11|nr:uncharacterized protein LOC131071936 isoform X2 [Cryptomeria japonica]